MKKNKSAKQRKIAASRKSRGPLSLGRGFFWTFSENENARFFRGRFRALRKSYLFLFFAAFLCAFLLATFRLATFRFAFFLAIGLHLLLT